MNNLEIIGWDTETYPIQPSDPAPRVVVNSFAGPAAFGPPRLEKGPATLGRLLTMAAARQCVLVGHNVSYDISVAMRTWPNLVPLFFAALDAGGLRCTRLQYKLDAIARGVDPRKSSLDFLASTVLDSRVPLDKGEDGYRLRFGELDPVPLDQWPQRAVDYAIQDAVVARELALALPQWPDWAMQTCYDFALRMMVVWGMRVDQEFVASERSKIAAEVAALSLKLTNEGLVRPNGTVNDAVVRQLIETECLRAGIPVPRTMLTGKVKADKSTLTRLCVTEGPLKWLQDMKNLQGVETKYLSKFAEVGSNALRPYVDSLKVTGRVSIADPPLQQLPRSGAVRECCVPRDGCAFVFADLDTAELRALGQACIDTVGFSRMAEAFQRDRFADLHTQLAAKILGITPEEAQKRKKAEDPVVLDARQRAKAANFGFPGGMGPARFIQSQADQGVVIPERDGYQLRQDYLSTWDEMPAYFDHVKFMLDTCGYVTTRVSQRVRGGCSFCEGANHGFQARTADVAKLLAYMFVRESMTSPGSPLWGSRLVGFMHDEIISETPIEAVHEVGQRMHELVQIAGRVHLPDVPSESTPCAALRWYKKAKAIYDENGRLIPWEPKKKAA